MSLALILSFTLLHSVPLRAATTPAPVVMSIDSAATSVGLVVRAPAVHATYLAPLEPICGNWCYDQKIFCCADPSESCNYTCAMQYIRCQTDCSLNSR